MTTTWSPLLDIPYLEDGQDLAEQQVNRAINRLESLGKLSIEDRDQTDSTAITPVNGQLWLVPLGGINAFADKDGQIAAYYDGWYFVRPKHGWHIFIQDELIEFVVDEVSATVTATFNENSPSADTLVRASGSWITDGFEDGMFLSVSGSVNNDGTPPPAGTGRNLATVTSATILTLDTSDDVAAESATAGVIVTAYKLVEAVCHAFPPTSQRVLMSTLGRGATPFLMVADVAYWVYLGYTQRRQVFARTEFNVAVTPGGGAQTAEIGLFSSPSPPDGSSKVLSKIEATGSVTGLTTTGMKQNSSAFTTVVPAGTHLWAGLRTNMAGAEPSVIGLSLDFSEGQILSTATAGALTGSGPWTGLVIGVGLNAICPDIRIMVD